MQHKKRGFTLIELLVVVLIVGILAAIAVPQYQRAVEKSRAAEAWTNLKAINEAVEMQKLKGMSDILHSDSFAYLDVSFTDADGNVPGAYSFSTKYYKYELGGYGATYTAYAQRIGKQAILSIVNGEKKCAGSFCLQLGFASNGENCVQFESSHVCYVE